MGSKTKNATLKIEGMTCENCQEKISRKLLTLKGVSSVAVSYITNSATISYDEGAITIVMIENTIAQLGYQVISQSGFDKLKLRSTTMMLTIIISLYLLLDQLGILNFLVPAQLAGNNMSYGMLFVIGLLSSVHCVAMCGGLNLAQIVARSNQDHGRTKGFRAINPSLLSNVGRVISYTLTGFGLGLAGSVFGGGDLAVLPFALQGIIKICVGVLMVIMGVNTLGIVPGLRRFQPRIPNTISNVLGRKKSISNRALVLGMLNGLMPCGPLQAMQIVALATGDPMVGAVSMLSYGLGTVPLMLGFGTFVLRLGRHNAKMMTQAGAILVAVLGLAMVSQGGVLSGLIQSATLVPIVIGLGLIAVIGQIRFKIKGMRNAAMFVVAVGILVIGTYGNPLQSKGSSDSAVNLVGGKQVVISDLESGTYPDIVVVANTPVRWIIDAQQGSINGCNYQVDLHGFIAGSYEFKVGENVLEFTPTKTGTYQYSCWMGMIRGTITVV